MTAQARLIIADPGLTSLKGHHLGYSQNMAEAALRRGMAPLILAGTDYRGEIGDGRLAWRAVFSTPYQTSGAGGEWRQMIFATGSRLPAGLAGMVAPPLRALRRKVRQSRTAIDGFGSELVAALAQEGATSRDIVLVHTVSAANIASLSEALAPAQIGRLIVVLRRPPEDMDIDDPAPKPIAALIRQMVGRFGEKLRLYADTDPLALAFTSATGLAVGVAAPPVEMPEIPARPIHALPHLVFPGGARLEKNYHCLPAIIAACRGRARFTLHSGVVDQGADPLIQRAHRTLQRMVGSDLRLIETPLPPADYAALLSDTDLALLPYDAAAYGARSSGILVEVLALGIPALVPAGCWMETAAGRHRAVPMRDGADAPAATQRALDLLPRLAAAARSAAPSWRRFHSPDIVLDTLLQNSESAIVA